MKFDELTIGDIFEITDERYKNWLYHKYMKIKCDDGNAIVVYDKFLRGSILKIDDDTDFKSRW